MVLIFYAFFRNSKQATIFLCLCHLLFTNSCDWDEYFSLLVTCFFFNLSTRSFRLNRLRTWCYPLLPRRNATKSSFVSLLLARLASQPAAMEWVTGWMMRSNCYCFVALFLGSPLSPGVAFSGFSWPFLYWLGKATLHWRLLERGACTR